MKIDIDNQIAYILILIFIRSSSVWAWHPAKANLRSPRTFMGSETLPSALYSTSNGFKNNLELHDMYQKFMNEYQSLVICQCFQALLLHTSVLSSASMCAGTTKLGVLYDASSNTSTSISLYET